MTAPPSDTDVSVGSVGFEEIIEYFNATTEKNFVHSKKRYTGYTRWPTPCEVADEMLTMVSCEYVAAERKGWSPYDWAEHCLKQERNIPDEDKLIDHYLKQWRF